MRRAVLSAALCLAFALCCVCLGACSSGEGDAASTQSEVLELGQADGAAASFTLANSSGKSVVRLAVSATGADDFSENLLSSDVHLKNGEAALIHVGKEALSGEGAIVDVKAVFGDGGVSVLHYLDLAEFSEATLLLDGKIGYVTYQGKTAGRLVSTLELQTYYYNLEDPDAAARDAAEEEEEKRRLEKLEEDLKATEESQEEDSTEEGSEDVQGSDVEDDPIEVSHEDTSDD